VNGCLDNDGTPDGKLLTPIPYRAQCSSVVIQSDGKIVVSGTAFDTNGSFIALARYDSYGTLDNTFGSGITVTPTSGLVTTEDGGQDSFTVVLDSQPTGDVTILISSSDETEGTVSPSSLTFTTDNWDTPQTVTATGLDDNEVDGGVGYTILVGPASSDDLTYSNMDPADVSVTNSDNDTQYVGTMHVADLSGTVRYAGPSWKALVTITVVDQAGNPVPNATVNGAWSEDISGYVAVLTGSNGQATATSGKIANSINSVIFTVETIVHESFDYAPTDNIETSIRVYQNGLTESLIAAAGQYQSVVLEPLTATGTTSWTQERAAVEPLFIEQHTASAEEAAPDDPVSSASVDQAITELDLDPLDDGLLEDLALAVL